MKKSFLFLTLILSSCFISTIQLTSALELPWNLVPGTNFTQRECMMCKFSVSLVNYALKTNKGAETIQRFSNSFCQIAHIESPVVCTSITRLFNHEIVKVLTNALITPDQICGYMSNNTCGHYHDPMGDWEVNLNASTSLNFEELEKLRLIHQEGLDSLGPARDVKAYKVVHISDTHVDIKYKENSIANCNEPLCCRANSTQLSKGLAQVKAGFWGSYGPCDVPLRTLESALKVINSTITKEGDVDYIIWTGDIQPHDVWLQDRITAIETYDAVFEKIFQYLPNVKIYPTFGNHEMIPVDSFSPSNLLSIARDDSPEWLYRKMESFWSRWLPAETSKTITKDGFYAATVRPGLKVISLNTNFCHNKNFWLYINSTDPGNQLQWLIHELQISELEHEQVHIIGHIPPGTDDCLKVWSKNYNRIVRRYAKTISGQFFGHTHSNEFEIFYDHDGLDYDYSQTNGTLDSSKILISKDKATSIPKPISVGLTGPSITTFIDLNPSFRIYTIDPSKSFSPTQFDTYFMNLTAANLLSTVNRKDNLNGTQSMEPVWEATSFAKDFNVPDIQPISMHNLLLEMVDELKDYQINSLGSHLDKLTKKNSNGIKRFKSKQRSIKATTIVEDKPAEQGGKLFKLFRMYYNYSDMYAKELFAKMTIDEKKVFLCKFFTSQSHNAKACRQFISDNVIFNSISII